MAPNDSNNISIPEYYRQFQPRLREDKASEVIQKPQPQKKPEGQIIDKTILFRGNSFTLNQPVDWEDKTIYTLMGPVSDGVQHNILITIDTENAFSTIAEYAELHIKTMENDLNGCIVLKKGEIKLANGLVAYEAIFSWYPTSVLRIYQHQIFIQSGKKVYKLTASFTKKTRQTIGPMVLRMMLSFDPCQS